MKNITAVFLIFLPAILSSAIFSSASPLSAQQTDGKADIKVLIQKLGDDSYAVRQRAEMQLLRIGLPAFKELNTAVNDKDSEIAYRAGRILRQFELAEQSNDNESVRLIIDAYTVETNPVQRAKLIQLLASPDIGFGNPGGEGLQTLCRILRFETERSLRVEAAKALIASAPHTESAREKWYQTLAEQKISAEQDELCPLVFQFAGARNTVNTLKKNTEKKYKEETKKSSMPLDYPVKLTADAQLLQQVKQLAAAVEKFQKAPENNTLVPGSWLDILVYYAMAELYDDLGLDKERDEAQRAALAVKTIPVKQEELLVPIDPLDGRPFNAHFYVARFLTERNRFRWTLDHCKLVIQDGLLSHRRDVLSMAANAAQMLGDNKTAADFLGQKIDLLKSDDYKKEFSDSDEQVRSNEARRFYYIAQEAADSGDWKKAAELIEEVLKRDSGEIDTLILRYESLRYLPEPDAAGKDKMKNLIEKATEKVERQMHGGLMPSVVCNQIAWLLANTDGDEQTALGLINITMKFEPESAVYLDTQAHVFALGKNFAKAVEAEEEALRLAPEAKVFRDALERFRKGH